jgi:hypothetical protein
MRVRFKILLISLGLSAVSFGVSKPEQCRDELASDPTRFAVTKVLGAFSAKATIASYVKSNPRQAITECNALKRLWTNRALNALAALDTDGGTKAALFMRLEGEIRKRLSHMTNAIQRKGAAWKHFSFGTWTSRMRNVGEEVRVFWGVQGHLVEIRPNGEIFIGKVATAHVGGIHRPTWKAPYEKNGVALETAFLPGTYRRFRSQSALPKQIVPPWDESQNVP